MLNPVPKCLVVSLQFPWMAEARLRLFPAGLFSCSFQQMLLGERWSLFLLAAGLVLLKLGSFLGFGTADESNSSDLPWSCSGLLPNCCSRAVLGLAQSLPRGRAVPSPRKTPTRWNACFGSVRTPGQTSQALGAGGILAQGETLGV